MRSLFGYFLFLDIEKQNERKIDFVCDHNFRTIIFNLVCFLLCDFIPFTAIFSLHLINFRKEAMKNEILDETIRAESDEQCQEDFRRGPSEDTVMLTQSTLSTMKTSTIQSNPKK